MMIVRHGVTPSPKRLSAGARAVHVHALPANVILMTFGFAVYFMPASYAVDSTVLTVWRVAVCLVSVIAVIKYLTQCEISLRWACLVLFSVSYYFLACVLNGAFENLALGAFYGAKIIGFCTLLEYGLTSDRDACLRSFLIAGLFMCGVHFITFLQYPLGMQGVRYTRAGELVVRPYFFFTHDNGSIFYFLPVIAGLWYYVCEYRRGFWIAFAFSALTLGMYWALWTVTALFVTAAVVVSCLLIYCFDCRRLRRLISYRVALLVGISFCVAVLLFYSSDLFANIAGALGKADDLGRGRIWVRAVRYIADSPVFGVGFEDDLVTTLKLGINHCHNIIMQVLYTGGCVAAAFALLALFRCDVEKEHRQLMVTKGQAVLCVSIIGFFVAATFDWYLYMPVQLFLPVLFRYSAPKEDAARTADTNAGDA